MKTKILQIIADALERDFDTMDINDEFREYEGWSSLAYLAVVSNIDDEFSIVIPIEDFRMCRTIAELARYIEEHQH